MGLQGKQGAIDPKEKGKTLSAASFIVTCEGKDAHFSELSGIKSEVETGEYMEVGEKGPQYGRFLGKAKPPEVTLKRSMTSGGQTTDWIWVWHTAARQLDPAAYKDCGLQLFGAGSDQALKTYYLVNAIPTKVDIGQMKAGASEVVLQTLTLQCDSIEEMPR